jgi:hypothetical protein
MRVETWYAPSQFSIAYGTVVWAVAQSIRSINVASIRIGFRAVEAPHIVLPTIHLVVAPLSNSVSL